MKVEMYVLDVIYDLAQDNLGDSADEFISNTLTDFFDLDLSAEEWIKLYWAELYPYIDATTENPIKYPQAFREETMYVIAYTFLSVLPSEVFHNVLLLQNLLVEAKRQLTYGLPIKNVVKYLAREGKRYKNY